MIVKDENDLLTPFFFIKLSPTGSESLRALSLQRNRLTGIRHLMVDIASTLKLSTSTIRIIERRDVQDKILVFGGMVVVCVVIWFLYFR